MSTTKIVSEIHKIEAPIRDVYNLLSDFNRIGRLVEMAKQVGLPGGMNMMKIPEKIEAVHFSEDICTVTVKEMGNVVIKIVEKEDPVLIKLEGGDGFPIKFNIWLQFLENGPYDTRLKITFQGELNLMLKMLLKGKLEKSIDQLGEGLSRIPYGMLSNMPL